MPPFAPNFHLHEMAFLAETCVLEGQWRRSAVGTMFAEQLAWDELMRSFVEGEPSRMVDHVRECSFCPVCFALVPLGLLECHKQQHRDELALQRVPAAFASAVACKNAIWEEQKRAFQAIASSPSAGACLAVAKALKSGLRLEVALKEGAARAESLMPKAEVERLKRARESAERTSGDESGPGEVDSGQPRAATATPVRLRDPSRRSPPPPGVAVQQQQQQRQQQQQQQQQQQPLQGAPDSGGQQQAVQQGMKPGDARLIF
jgi:hypothetical protein